MMPLNFNRYPKTKESHLTRTHLSKKNRNRPLITNPQKPTICPSILSTMSKKSLLDILSDDLRKAVIKKTITYNQKVVWGESIVFKDFSLPEYLSQKASGTSMLLEVSLDMINTEKNSNDLYRIQTKDPRIKNRFFYPSHFLMLFSPNTSVEEKFEAKKKILAGYGGMNCNQYVYFCMDHLHSYYPKLFSLIHERSTVDPNAPYEPLGYKKSKLFGYCPENGSFKTLLYLPPNQRNGFQVPSKTIDPYSQNNPRPGDLIFFMSPKLKNYSNFKPIDKQWQVRHVCIFVGYDKDNHVLVSSNYRFPLENKNTSSISRLDELLSELQKRLPDSSYYSITTTPIKEVQNSVEEFIKKHETFLHNKSSYNEKSALEKVLKIF
jgi:hypothetical protein